jgi:hypothetical protein
MDELYKLVTAAGGFLAAAALGMLWYRLGRMDQKFDKIFELREHDLEVRAEMQADIRELQSATRHGSNGRARA